MPFFRGSLGSCSQSSTSKCISEYCNSPGTSALNHLKHVKVWKPITSAEPGGKPSVPCLCNYAFWSRGRLRGFSFPSLFYSGRFTEATEQGWSHTFQWGKLLPFQPSRTTQGGAASAQQFTMHSFHWEKVPCILKGLKKKSGFFSLSMFAMQFLMRSWTEPCCRPLCFTGNANRCTMSDSFQWLIEESANTYASVRPTFILVTLSDFMNGFGAGILNKALHKWSLKRLNLCEPDR